MKLSTCNRCSVVGQLDLAPKYDVIIVTTLPSPSEFTSVHLAESDRKRGYDYLARVFDPSSGVPEDPVTGSAHCLLTPYWATKFRDPPNETLTDDKDNSDDRCVHMRAKQVSERGGVLDVTWDKQKGVCRLESAAVIVAEGVLYL